MYLKTSRKLLKGRLFLLLLLSFSLLGCFNKNAPGGSEKPLFDLSLGKLPKQMYLFSEDKFIPNTRNYIRSSRGNLYISDKSSKKIMGFTSYGDLIYLIQNSNFSGNTTQGNSNFVITNYPFNQIGLIAISPEGTLYVQEELPLNSQIFDASEKTTLENIILRFDSKGNFKDFLGQQGINSEPFGIILQMEMTLNGDLVVISQMPTKKVVYWFNSAGSLLWQINLDEESLPLPKDVPQERIFANLQDIYPAPLEKKIYLSVVYYETVIDPNTLNEMGIRVHSQKIIGFNLNSKTYDEEIPIPLIKDSSNDIPYTLEIMGVIGNNIVLRLSDYNIFNLTFIMVNRSNYRYKEQKIQFPVGENLDLNISAEGVLTAMFLQKDKVGIYWWPLGDSTFGF